MPVQIPCPCGKTLKVQDSLMGKKVKCPACAEILDVPASPPPPYVSAEVIFDEIASTPRPSKPVLPEAAPTAPETSIIASVSGATTTLLAGGFLLPSPFKQGRLTLSDRRVVENSQRLGGTRHAELLLSRVDAAEIASHGNVAFLLAGLVLLGIYGLGLLFLLAFVFWRAKYLVIRSGTNAVAVRVKGDGAAYQAFLEAVMSHASKPSS